MPDSPNASSADPAEQIAAALAKLRGRRMPRPPWAGDGAGDAGPWGARRGMHDFGGGPHGFGGHGGPHGGRGARGMHGGSDDGADASDSSGRGRAMPGWPGGPPARFGGPARLRLLEALAAASSPLSVGEIADAVGVDQPRASRLVQQSVELGLVRREADPEDARRTRTTLTDAGSAIARGFRGERRGSVEAALATFSDAERADLARLLAKLAAAWPQS